MRLDIITIFPEMVNVPLSQSLIGRGREKGLYAVNVHDLRDFTYDKHRVVDDVPYGGGPGMVIKPEPIIEALEKIDPDNKALRLITSAAGELFTQQTAIEFSGQEWIIIICGHYKGIDQRAVTLGNLREISIGDYVLTGGEHAAAVITDAVLRLLPGTMKDFGSAEDDSHYSGILGPEEYTRPDVFKDATVPPVLVSGHHEKIRRWRLGNALHRTKTNRLDLFAMRQTTEKEIEIMNEYENSLKMEIG
ncbi:MAG: tRNA (guanosine(37)-N1)-methyltransferase TrmD [candidate division Zixibacteria bacterium]